MDGEGREKEYLSIVLLLGGEEEERKEEKSERDGRGGRGGRGGEGGASAYN